MLVAAITAFFILGFGCAIVSTADPKRSRAGLRRFFENLSVFFQELSASPSQLPGLPTGELPNEHNLEVGLKTLLTREQLQSEYEVGTWQHVAFEEFSATLLARERDSKRFPCVYATRGFRANDHRYVFLDSDNPSEPRNIRLLGPAIRAYLHEAHQLGPNTSLVIICAPSDNVGTVKEYNNRFWSFLRGLRIYDSKEWPAEVPVETTSEHWTFCFNGEPLFPIALTPAHDKRRSRYASNLIIAMQPKWVIDNLMSTPEKRKNATSTVRGLLKEYDEVEISPDLADYGKPGARESRQLTLLDNNNPSECPFDDFDR